MANVNIKNLDPAVFLNSVGIGTSPSYDLHVKPSAGNADFVLEKASAASILIQANSTTTKMGSQSNHPLLLLVNSSEKLRVLNSGMVGINETAPTTTNSNILEVKSSANSVTSAIRITNKDANAGTGQGAALDFGLSRNTGAFKPQAGKIAVGREQDWTSDDAKIDAFMSFSVYQNNALSEKMRITSTGKIGINNTDPSYKLTVTDGSSSIAFAEYSNGANIWLDGDDGNFSGGGYFNILADGSTALRFGFNGSAKMSMLANGNVEIGGGGKLGIGTNAPEGDVEIVSDGSASTGSHLRLTHANNNATDIISTINFSNNVGSVGKIVAGTTGANNTGYISFFTDNAGTSSEKMRILADGGIIMASLPTSDPGVAGALYRSGNDVKVSTG